MMKPGCAVVRAAVILLFAVLCAHAPSASSGRPGVDEEAGAVYPQALALYVQLHQAPELSLHEEKTAAKLASELRNAGFVVTTGVGGFGVVGVLANGAGPVVMLRTEMDALPVEEKTGLAYASTVRALDENGVEVGVSHACGHDLHMAAWVATAKLMSADRSRWRGTLVLIAQPAEELISGARAMLADGLLSRFPHPDFALAIHDDARFPAGVVGYRAGPIMTNGDSVDITIYGKGGHAARPDSTVDPVVIAAKTIQALQAVVSREISPLDPAVITVGTVHGGTRRNIIPDEVKLELTVRSFTEPVQRHLLEAIDRISKLESAASNSPRDPLVVHLTSAAHALVNDEQMTRRTAAALTRELGAQRVQEFPPEMVSEDFSEFERAGVPTLMLRVGAAKRSASEAAIGGGEGGPSLHSPYFAPDIEPALKTAIATEVIALRVMLPKPSASAIN